jgi:hypothetical protein
VIDSPLDGGTIVMLKGCSATSPSESVIWTVKENVPAVFGVPAITPAELIVNPGGKEPLESNQE